MKIDKLKLLRNNIRRHLNVLKGKTLWASGRAADLQWFQFGDRKTVLDIKKIPKEVGEYALHVQCCWRICLKNQIIVGSVDRYYPRDGKIPVNLDFDWDKPGMNFCDAQIESFVRRQCPIKVKSIIVDSIGGFQLLFERGFCLSIFPDSSRSCEFWRLFQPSQGTKHIVFEGQKLKF